jgi:uncharacterized protein
MSGAGRGAPAPRFAMRRFCGWCLAGAFGCFWAWPLGGSSSRGWQSGLPRRGRWPSCAWLLALCLAAVPAHAAAAAAASDCPPQAAPPTPEQRREGLRDARDRGLLWRLDKDGQTGWLYGTLHVGRPAWAYPGPLISQALRDADTVALELDLTDPAVLAALGQAIAALQARDAARPLSAPLQARLAALARADCITTPAFSAQPALLQATGLATLAGRRDGLDPAFAQEFALGDLARAANKALVSLESPAGQLAALVPDDPADLTTMVAQQVEQLESGETRRVLGRAAALWARGDLEALAHYAEWCACADSEADRAQLRRLNDARNPVLADAIATLLGSGRRVFAAVGALHMTGPQALPLLMVQRGWRVERVTWPAP